MLSRVACRRAIVVASAVALLVTPARAQTRAAQIRELEAYITKGVQDWDIPGLTVAVVRNDSVLFAKGFGVRRLAAPGAVDAETEFGIMSTTKAFTALAMAMLVDEGKVAWGDPITKHLPEFQFSDPFLTREATVKDLLTHNIGLGNADLMWARGDLSRTEILKRVRYVPTAYSLRGGFTYQNIMYGAAGEVIARVSGMSWEDFVRTRILTPLGMAQTYTTYASMHAASGANRSEPHFRIRDTIRVIADETVDVLPAAGSIWSNANDMAKWVRFLLDSGRVSGKRLVSERQFRALLEPHSFVTRSEFYPTAQITKPHWTTYGLGWFQQDFRGRFLAFHTGSLDGRTAMMGLLPDAKVGVFIAGNLDHAEFRHALLLQVMDIFAGTNGGAPRNWSTEFLALYKGLRAKGDSATVAIEAKRAKDTKPTLPIGMYAGTYAHPVWGDLVIRDTNGTLSAHLGPNAANSGTLEQFHYDTFRTFLGDGRGGANFLMFQLDAAGTVTRVVMNGDDGYTFTRVPSDR
ncbi:MAG: serine hydrolase [Gemmatimonadaceae bacterium]|nr:serine hydrolase [Gemmatimonadaceae bacterium]